MLLLNGCSKAKQNNINNIVVTPTTQPVVTLTPTAIPEDNKADSDEKAKQLSVEDYYPLQADTEYIYTGEGNEFAAYHRYIDYLDPIAKKIQTRTNNGGTETVRVIEVKDGKVTVVFLANECYYRANFMDKANQDKEILLMEPFIVGTKWTLPNGRKRSITQTKVPIETPYGSFEALEVTTKETDGTTKDYYAVGVGLVKSIYEADQLRISSTLDQVNTDRAFTQNITVYYPDADEKIYTEQVTLSFKTGDDLILAIENAIKKEASKDTYLPLLSADTRINSLYLDKNQIVHVDFSKEFVDDMNAGAGYELRILQSITNTLCNYYGVSKVSITLEGKPYESGHVIMRKGEVFELNMENVVQ
jgi:hypothetical protein